MKINIIGRGNVGWHLSEAFKDKAEVINVNPHTLAGLDVDADLTIISVTDTVIPSILEHLPSLRGIVAHTSGSTGIEVLEKAECRKFNSYGVFYPLQTFTKGKALDYSKIPFFIEGSDDETEEKLMQVAEMVSGNVVRADSEKRKALHIASVFACNFANHLWTIAEDYLKAHDLDLSMLLPLIEETCGKIETLSPEKAQTGPAVRNDSLIISNHIEMLKKENNDNWRIYQMLSESIINRHKTRKLS